MKYTIKVTGNPMEAQADIVKLRDALDKVIQQDFAQVIFIDNPTGNSGIYKMEISPSTNGVVAVSSLDPKE